MIKKVIFPLLCLFVIAVSGVTAQEISPPPQVIDIYPIPGVELSPTDPLQIAFDQPMDSASVQAAFTVDPAVEGVFAWNNPSLLTFVPQRGWARDTRYTITIGGSAAAQTGTPFSEPYVFEVQTVRPPRVTSVVPEPDSDAAAANARIVVSFDRPIAPLTTTGDLAAYPSPIVISPPLDGVGEWINASIYSFTPSGYYPGGADVTVTVPAGFTAADGSATAEDFTWVFTTLPPQMVSTNPANNDTEVPLNGGIQIIFSQSMDRASVESNFQLYNGETYLPVNFVWSDDSTEVIAQPVNLLTLETEYRVTISQSAFGADGGSRIEEPIAFSFRTLPYPAVQETDPFDGQTLQYLLYSARITFNTDMNWETLRDRIVISPQNVGWYPQTYESDLRTVWLQFENPPTDTDFQITVLAGVEDIYGNPTLSDKVFSFRTMSSGGNTVYPIINGNFVMTSAYNPDTFFRLMASGTSHVDFNLYDINMTDLSDEILGQYDDFLYMQSRGGNYGLSGNLPPFMEMLFPLRSWSSVFEVGDTQTAVYVPLSSDNGGQLAPGLYWLGLNADVGAGANMYGASETNTYQMALAVTTANITVKRTASETFIWVTDMQSGGVVPNAAVQILQDGVILASGVTDSNGIFRAPVVLEQSEAENEHVFVEVTGDGVYGAWYSNSESDLPTGRAYLYTDRPVYRPGETIYYRGVLRDRRDMDFSVPDQATAHLELRPVYDSTVLWEADVDITAFGTFSGSFTVPPDAPIGLLKLYVDFGDSVSYQFGYVGSDYEAENATSVTFRIAEFRVPEFEVQVTPQTDSIIQGDTLTAVVNASYYSGGALGDSPVEWNVIADMASFDYQGSGRWDFTPEFTYQDAFYSQQLLPEGGGGRQSTDAGGNAILETVSTVAPSPRPMIITIEGTITDQSGQAISGRAEVFAHVADAYVGLRTEGYVYPEDQPVNVDLLAVTPDSAVIPNAQITYEIELIRWVRQEADQFGQYNWVEQAVAMGTGATRVGADGLGSTTFTPSTPGVYRVRATIADAQGRVNTSSLRFYVRGEGSVTYTPNTYGIGLITDRETYVPGDTASVFMQLPYDSMWTLLITSERADVMTHEVVTVSGESFVYELPITEAFAPNFYLSVAAIKGGSGYYGDPSLPDYDTSSFNINVTPTHRILNIEVEPSSEAYEPGDTAAFTVRVTDMDGNPVVAEVGAALTDEAVLDLAPPNSAPQIDVFYQPTTNYVTTRVAMSGLIDILEDATFPSGYGGGGGGDDGGGGLIRDDFEYTPLWESIVTDANGTAEVSVELPDNLTTWRFDARAVTMDTDVGEITRDVVASLPLLIRPAAPRFFVVGDQVTLAAIVQNNTDTDQTVDVSLQAVGMQVNSPASQSVTIPAGSRTRVSWDVVVLDVEGVDLVFSAQAASGLADAARPALTNEDGLVPVYAYSAPDTTGTGGILRPGDAVSQTVAIPPRYEFVEGALDVRVDTSMLDTAFGALDYLRDYPYASSEYTASLVIANALTLQAESLAVLTPEQLTTLMEAVSAGVESLLADRNADGGWGYFPTQETNALITAYVTLALIEARDSGFEVDPAVIENGLQIAREDAPLQTLNRGAFYLYVRARSGEDITSAAAPFLEDRLELNHAGKSFLLLALAVSGAPADMTDELVSDLLTSATLTSTGAQWDEARPDWLNWDSDTRSTALALLALTTARPENDLLPNAARWLITARRGDGWETTQETVWALQALIAYGREVEGGAGEFPYEVTFNGDVVLTPEEEQAAIPVGDFAVGALNRLTFTRGGDAGLLYYTSFLNLRLPAEDITALNRGVSVRRDYYIETNTETTITSAQVGDTITVRLTITVPQDIYFFVLDDPLPAGVEPLDPNLLITSQGVDDPALRPLNQDDPFWFWNWFVFNRTELRDSRAVLYADFLASGTYVYSYQVRAVTPGVYQVMPAQGFAQYQPDVFGRTAGDIFTVTE